MNIKKKAATMLAPLAKKSTQWWPNVPCASIFHQPKMPKKLMKTVK